MSEERRRIRCAIYTRKSSEEGLEQEFNSLDAQREACEAYIASQRSEGWLAMREGYDDGGYSGGNLERPGLQNLMEDIRGGLVDVIVVYKIDRLSRSLMDFARLVEVFDEHKVTFVSVTQSFNTTTSMGRLTLNVLLSFAQFEREVTGERIRDKIAASRAKGMWMGGFVPWGYDAIKRKLVINEAEAAEVRYIFERFVELGSATRLTRELVRKGITNKRGRPIDKGFVYQLLRNRVYLGEAVHKGTSYPGEHMAIIDQVLWDRVQTILKISPRTRANNSRSQTDAMLKGLLFTDTGAAMTPTHTRRGDKLYRYYISMDALKNRGDEGQSSIVRLNAGMIESAVVQKIRQMLRTPEIAAKVCAALKGARSDLTEGDVAEALATFDGFWDNLFPAEQDRTARLLIERVVVSKEGMSLDLRTSGLSTLVSDMLQSPKLDKAA